MITKPPMTIIDLGGVNQWIGAGRPKIAIVNHIAQGSLAACDSWFRNPAAQASANYIVALDGAIHQYVDPEGPNAPYANGLLNHPDTTVQALVAQENGANPNYWSVSIEHEGMSGQAMPAAQLAASAQLTAWLLERFNIPNDESHLLGHYEFDSVTRAGCPGWSRAEWIAYEAAVNAAVGTPTPGPDPRDAEIDTLRAALAAIQQTAGRVLA